MLTITVIQILIWLFALGEVSFHVVLFVQINDRAAENANQDYTARMSCLILHYTLRKSYGRKWQDKYYGKWNCLIKSGALINLSVVNAGVAFVKAAKVWTLFGKKNIKKYLMTNKPWQNSHRTNKLGGELISGLTRSDNIRHTSAHGIHHIPRL